MLNILPYVLAVSRSQIRNNSRSRKISFFVRTTKANENNINMHYGNLHFFESVFKDDLTCFCVWMAAHHSLKSVFLNRSFVVDAVFFRTCVQMSILTLVKSFLSFQFFSPQKYGIEKEGERERESGSCIELRRKRENK